MLLKFSQTTEFYDLWRSVGNGGDEMRSKIGHWWVWTGMSIDSIDRWPLEKYSRLTSTSRKVKFFWSKLMVDVDLCIFLGRLQAALFITPEGKLKLNLVGGALKKVEPDKKAASHHLNTGRPKIEIIYRRLCSVAMPQHVPESLPNPPCVECLFN